MKWDLIPEIFYDFIARIVPGSVLILTTAMVCLGPRKVIRFLVSDSTEIDAKLILLFLLLTYSVAVVIAPVWTALSDLTKKRRPKKEEKANNVEGALVPTSPETGHDRETKSLPSSERTLFQVRKELPQEASRLIKMQAERGLCEVLIVGFTILWPVNLVLCFCSPYHRIERLLLLAAMSISILSCFRWRNSLQRELTENLDVLQDILKDQKKKSDTKAQKWWKFWKWLDS